MLRFSCRSPRLSNDIFCAREVDVAVFVDRHTLVSGAGGVAEDQEGALLFNDPVAEVENVRVGGSVAYVNYSGLEASDCAMRDVSTSLVAQQCCAQ